MRTHTQALKSPMIPCSRAHACRWSAVLMMWSWRMKACAISAADGWSETSLRCAVNTAELRSRAGLRSARLSVMWSTHTPHTRVFLSYRTAGGSAGPWPDCFQLRSQRYTDRTLHQNGPDPISAGYPPPVNHSITWLIHITRTRTFTRMWKNWASSAKHPPRSGSSRWVLPPLRSSPSGRWAVGFPSRHTPFQCLCSRVRMCLRDNSRTEEGLQTHTRTYSISVKHTR